MPVNVVGIPIGSNIDCFFRLLVLLVSVLNPTSSFKEKFVLFFLLLEILDVVDVHSIFIWMSFVIISNLSSVESLALVQCGVNKADSGEEK